MPTKAEGYVTDVPYVPSFIRELAPAWLDHVALISGFAPPARNQGFTYCDLGCGLGVTTAILAATHPAGRFHGIDAMAPHIEAAGRLASDIALTNVRFHATDFDAASAEDLPAFEYIVSHGVYSWVEPRIQASLRGFIQRHLKPGGLVYISYNAMPGRAADLPLQRLVRALGRTFSGDSATRVTRALEIVRAAAEIKTPALVASPFAEQFKQSKERFQTAYLAHELMGDYWEPQCVTDVRAAMRAIGLEPVGSATLMENYDSHVLGAAARGILADIADDDVRELARDFFIDQFFRRDVFVRDGRRLDEKDQDEQLLNSTYALAQPAGTVEYSVSTAAGQLKFDNDVARAIVSLLASGPSTLAALATDSGINANDLLANTQVLSAAGAVWPVEPGRASVTAVNRAIRQRLDGPEQIRHLALSCGTALPINDAVREYLRGGEIREGSNSDQWRDFLLAHGL